MRSTLNPRFGVLASEETKRKIGDSTRLRFQTPEFKEKHKAGMLRFFSTESGLALKHKLSVLRKSKPKKPKAVTMCKVCGILHNTGGITCKSSVCLPKESIRVWSYCEDTKTNEFMLVTDGFLTKESAEVIEIETSTGERLVLTPDHKVYTKNRGWVEAQDLTDSDELVVD